MKFINLVFLLGLLWTPDPVTCQIPYNQFQLVQAWILTFCKKYSGCFPNLTPNFTLHGLWPATRTGNSLLNCGKSRKDSYIRPETTALAGPLASAWPSIIIGRTDSQLWQYEWDKHGTCCLSRITKMDYFLSVIRERNKMDLLSILGNANIVPRSDVSYTKLDFENVLTQFTGVGNSIYVSCYALNNTHVQLFEIYTCLNYFATQVIPCPVSTQQRGCTGSIVFLP
ncbi:Ribonuclease 3 [Camellia lanceoleosa]|uniref:Ribonuclease 3 n=1 Tax=Camellia lanceoleosa TaxID=1840588 RepID=A0ACC0G4B6_9ERIC|nr:Ribonuclease 3 [Camellia lanceoleosa]